MFYSFNKSQALCRSLGIDLCVSCVRDSSKGFWEYAVRRQSAAMLKQQDFNKFSFKG